MDSFYAIFLPSPNVMDENSLSAEDAYTPVSFGDGGHFTQPGLPTRSVTQNLSTQYPSLQLESKWDSKEPLDYINHKRNNNKYHVAFRIHSDPVDGEVAVSAAVLGKFVGPGNTGNDRLTGTRSRTHTAYDVRNRSSTEARLVEVSDLSGIACCVSRTS
ncbi:uncharacterized protein EI90DRAFT_3014904 [Cantharellus anzutake]|uniref:uncharacterized protein n=1 Tax=Cantharellus anzutake TaxID=1750568 RepID=UPI0019044759|nr:uncharacterized protein EI90DRAFT_3014904 [Cantharellus anzutake]KAF8334640.1 hypothetical protein EI90DRAFT_3014904 [Cantharellus anzutake]